MADLTSKFSSLNPFAKSGDKGDDRGEEIGAGTHGGGRSSYGPNQQSKAQLRVSHALKSFLAHEKILSSKDAGVKEEGTPEGLRALLDRSHVEVPRELLDRSHPLPEYFISSSHNTYLIAHQLFGSSDASAYETALKTGSRCVEIDAWDDDDSKDEPKVTHGYTLVSHVPFRKVCETIVKVLIEEIAEADKVAPGGAGRTVAPIMISLENHCGPHGQQRLVDISHEVFGQHLVTKQTHPHGQGNAESAEHVSLQDIGPKVAFIVEYHLPDEPDSSDTDSSDSSDDEDEKKARKSYKDTKKEQTPSGIIPELAELGVYAQSVKPANQSWFNPGRLVDGPHHHLINVSESGLGSHLPSKDKANAIARHNAQHLMRVYPKGTRISSSNLKPVPYWGIGAQICALNWQTFGLSNQLNAALFDGSDGYVLKPAALRPGGSGNLNTGRKKKLRLHVAGASNVPLPDSNNSSSDGNDDAKADIKPYLTCTLHHPDDLSGEPPKRKTEPYKHHKLGFLHRGENPAAVDPVWDESLEWEYQDNELVFLRMLIKSDDSWARNPMFAVAAVRLSYVVPGWTFVRMLDMKGQETRCTVLVKFEVTDA